MNKVKYALQYTFYHTKQSLLSFWLGCFPCSSLLIYRDQVIHPTHLSFITTLIELCDKLDIRPSDTKLWFNYWRFVKYSLSGYSEYKDIYALVYSKNGHYATLRALECLGDIADVSHAVRSEVHDWIVKEYGMPKEISYSFTPSPAYEHGCTAGEHGDHVGCSVVRLSALTENNIKDYFYGYQDTVRYKNQKKQSL